MEERLGLSSRVSATKLGAEEQHTRLPAMRECSLRSKLLQEVDASRRVGRSRSRSAAARAGPRSGPTMAVKWDGFAPFVTSLMFET